MKAMGWGGMGWVRVVLVWLGSDGDGDDDDEEGGVK